MSRLARRPELNPSEPLETYISRLAATNGASSISEFRLHMNLREMRGLSDPEKLNRLVELSGLDADLMRSQFAMSWLKEKVLSDSTTGYRTYEGRMRLNRWELATTAPRFCPLCLKADFESGYGCWEARPHVRFAWLLNYTETCVEHCVRIFTSPEKYTRTTQYDFAAYLRTNRREVERAIANATAEDLHPYDVYFARRFERKATSMELLDTLNLALAHQLCFYAARAKELAGDPTTRFKSLVHPSRSTRIKGFELLADRERLLECLSAINREHLKRAKITGRYRLYGELERFLTIYKDAPGLRPIIELIRERAMSEVPIGPEDPFLGGGGVRKLHTLHTGMQETGVNSRTIRKILDERGLIKPSDLRKSDNRVVCAASDVLAAARDFKNGIDQETVAQMLGVSRPTVKRIVDKGLIKPMIGYSNDMNSLFTSEQIEAFIEHVVGQRLVADETKSTTSLNIATKTIACQMADVVEAVVTGRLSKVYRSSDETKIGLAKVLIDNEELRTAFVAPSGGLTCSEFSRALKLRTHVGRLLFQCGLFETTEFHDSVVRRSYPIIEHDRYRDFRDQYASVTELAKGVMWHTELKKILKDEGIKPVWAHGHLSSTTFYRRSDVERILSRLP
jgi:predicted transcriptional regulator